MKFVYICIFSSFCLYNAMKPADHDAMQSSDSEISCIVMSPIAKSPQRKKRKVRLPWHCGKAPSSDSERDAASSSAHSMQLRSTAAEAHRVTQGDFMEHFCSNEQCTMIGNRIKYHQPDGQDICFVFDINSQWLLCIEDASGAKLDTSKIIQMRVDDTTNEMLFDFDNGAQMKISTSRKILKKIMQKGKKIAPHAIGAGAGAATVTALGFVVAGLVTPTAPLSIVILLATGVAAAAAVVDKGVIIASTGVINMISPEGEHDESSAMQDDDALAFMP